ncbi:MAG: hypothetical protein RL404_843 [Pseudomonadota bacterium]|jgi:hypothetical protein
MTRNITLDSSMNYRNVLRDVGRMGVLRVDHQYTKNGITHVVLHERTWGEWLKETFLTRKEDLANTRQAVAAALEPIIRKQGSAPPEQLVQNIRDRVAHGINITGRALARDYAPVNAGKNPKPLQGGTVAARGTGHGIRVLGAPPASIRCDHAILRDSTAAAALRGSKYIDLVNQLNRPDTADERDEVGEMVSVPSAAADSWNSIKDVRIPTAGATKAQRTTSQLQAALATALKGKHGAVVVELLPDTYTETKGIGHWSCSDEGMIAQWQVARDAIQAAKITKDNLVISFASADVDELKRMKQVIAKAVAPIDADGANGMIAMLDDDSDSDNDDELPIVTSRLSGRQ